MSKRILIADDSRTQRERLRMLLARAGYEVETFEEALEATRKESRLLDIAIELEKHALDDEYFTDRKLYPNVDYWSGIIYEAMDIPADAFTVMFAIGRTPGWMAS